MPSPLKFLPIWSTISTSHESTRILGIRSADSCKSPGSNASISSAATATILQVSSYAFSIVGTANRIGAFLMMHFPNKGTFLPIFLNPASWQTSAPYCFPSPIAIIFIIPLWYGPRNAVCGLILHPKIIPSASAAFFSI